MKLPYIPGAGTNHDFASTPWHVEGTYNLENNTVTWKKFFGGEWSGRVVQYEGKLIFEANTVSIEGTTVLQSKEVPENLHYSTHCVGDTGNFKLTSTCDPTSLVGLYESVL